jgi:hypothetical protein
MTPKEARLILKHGDDTVEDEVWTMPSPLSRTEAREFAGVVFSDAYDLMNAAAHGE